MQIRVTSVLDFSTCDKEGGFVGLFAVLSDRLIIRCIVPCTRDLGPGVARGDHGKTAVRLPGGSAPQAREATTWPRCYQGTQLPGRGIMTTK